MLSLAIELTDNCNLSCKMCSHSRAKDGIHGRPPKFLSFKKWDLFLQSLKEIKRKKQVSPFWDGESLLHPEFNKFIKYAFENNQNNVLFDKFSIITNGVLLDKEKTNTILNCASISFMKENTFHFLHFSIDAISRETYLNIKGEDMLNIVTENIKNFVRERENRKQTYPKIIVAFIVMKENFKEGKKFYKYWKSFFEKNNLDYEFTFDQPNQDKDAIYFRQLSLFNPKEDKALHESMAKLLGYSGPLRNKEIF